MTTDERLDRLTEKHGALAESLQLLTAEVQSMATKHGALAESLQLLTADVQSLVHSVREHDRILRGHADLIGDLARIAGAHQQRIDRLEGRQS
jgi:chromosome segregation ATPase